VAIGSMATVAVLIAAAFVVPRFLRTEAGVAARPAVQEPARQAPADPAPITPAPVETPSPAADDVRPPEPAPRRVAAQTPPARGMEPAPRSAEPPVSVPAQQQIAQPQPQSLPPAPSQTQPQVNVPPPGPSRAEMNAIREEYNNLAIRAGTVKTGLQNLQNQMGGLSLRADMREAATRLDYLMQEAMSSLKSGDVENAKRNLEMADRTAERIEKFLTGR
jgi:predicted component of type VI protein secretion system